MCSSRQLTAICAVLVLVQRFYYKTMLESQSRLVDFLQVNTVLELKGRVRST